MNDQYSLVRDIELEIANTWQFLTDASLTRDRQVIDSEAAASRDRVLKSLEQLGTLQPAFRDRADS